MRILALTIPAILVLLLAAGCPRHETGKGGQGAASTSGQGTSGAGQQGEAGQGAPELRPGVPQVALVLSGTQGDAWGREIVQTAASDLGFTAWSYPSDFQGLDTFGPYDVKFGDTDAQLHIAFSGLMSVATLPEQQALGKRCKEWMDGFEPKVVWLDGDIAQFQVGSLVELDIPIVFTGVVLDADLYYSQYRPFTGVYKRHGLSAVLGKVWEKDPEAKTYALVSDDSPMSASEVRRFVDIQQVMPEGHTFTVEPTVHSWSELRDVFKGLDKSVDAVIVCGMGNQGASPELLNDDCPANLLSGVKVPVVTLGPTRMDQSGALTVMIRPAAHAREGLKLVGDLLQGQKAESLPVVTPDDMSVFQNQGKQAK